MVVDMVLAATGRTRNLDRLNLTAAGVATDDGGGAASPPRGGARRHDRRAGRGGRRRAAAIPALAIAFTEPNLVAVGLGMDAAAFAEQAWYHPVLEEMLQAAARDIDRQLG